MASIEWLYRLSTPTIKYLADLRLRKVRAIGSNPFAAQDKLLRSLIQSAKRTRFGRDHGFSTIKHYKDFARRIPIRDYEGLLPYVDAILSGERDVLWKGRPVALASTSGTSSGPIKYIPVTRDSAPSYRIASRDSVLAYISETGNGKIIAGKMFFMSQNPEYQRVRGMPVAPISGVSVARVPRIFRQNLLPSAAVSCIEDWEEKLDAMLEETTGQNLTLIAGIPPWLQLFFDHVIEKTGKRVGDVFPNLYTIVHGGANFSPYQARIEKSIGKPVDMIETYAATEGFIAFQDFQNEPGMLLNLMGGIFFEFVPADEIHSANPVRLSLKDVELGENYAIILTTNAGLWAYDIGDTVKFVSRDPYRIVVTGRTKHFISAFGEHVIVEQVDAALAEIITREGIEVREFTVAPQIQPTSGLPHHEWFIEFENSPVNLERFATQLDGQLRQGNIIYNGLVEKNILQSLKIRVVRRYGFKEYMESIGKLGGQNKVPRLLNDRRIADAMEKYLVISNHTIERR